MPVTTDTLRNMPRLNLLFALSSFAAFGSLMWMLYADHERPWRDHQRDYFDVQAAMAHFELVGLESDESKAQREALQKAVREAELKLQADADKERDLLKQQELTAGRLQAAALAFGNSNATIQVTMFEFEEHRTLHGADAPETRKVAARLEAEKARLDELRVVKEKLEDSISQIKRDLKTLREPLATAERALGAFDKKVADARKREQMFRGGLVSYRRALNLPGLDFVAPKGTMGREEIKQVVLPDVHQEYNFLQSYTIDRCTTCHLAIDKPDATPEALYGKIMAAFRAVNQKRVEQGQPPLEIKPRKARPVAPDHGAAQAAETDHAGADHAGQNGASSHAPDAHATQAHGHAAEPDIDWKNPPPFEGMTRAQQKRYLAVTAETLAGYLSDQGLNPIDFREPLFAHPRLDLFVSADSSHPVSRMGCTACHEGNGQETDFVYAAHTPATHAQEHEWADKYYVRTLGVPQGTFALIEHYWDRPMLHPRYAQATCAKCHTEVADLRSYHGDEPAAKLTRGRQLFTQLGCANCHLVEGLGDSRRVGPDLVSVNQKLDTGFLHNWIYEPREFRPSTMMPHFFRQENNLPSSRNEYDADPELRSRVEVQAVTHYLQTFSRDFNPLPVPEGVTGNAERGWTLFTQTGCLACHSNLHTIDPDDDKKRPFGQRWIEDDLVHRAGMPRDKAAAQAAGMSYSDQARYAMEHFTEERHAAAKRKLERLRTSGDDTDGFYVPPYYTRFAPDLSGMGSKLVPDASNEALAAKGRQWLYNWLRQPQHYHPGTKMPQLFNENYYWRESDIAKRRALADQDLMDLTEYLLGLRLDGVKTEPFQYDSVEREMTQSLIRQLLAGQYSDAAADALLADRKTGPQDELGPLTNAIVKQVESSIGRDAALAKVQAQDIEGRRQLYLGVRMITHYGCYACHTIAGYETASRPGTELTYWGEKRVEQLDYAFFSPGFEALHEEQKGRFDQLYPDSAEFEGLVRWNGNEPTEVLHNRGSFAYHKFRNPRIWDRGKIKKPYEKLKMPSFFLNRLDSESLVTFVLSRVHPLVSRSVQAQYAGSPLGGVAKGRHLVTELNCIGCHKIEDNEPVIQQYHIRPDPAGGIKIDEINSPPWLHGEGAKINHNWLHVFLRNVEMLRPWLKVRMPTFHLEQEQATALVDYFASVSRREASEVAKRLSRVHDFMNKAAKAAGPSASKPDDKGRVPGDGWFAEDAFASVKRYLAEYALRYRLSRPAQLDEKENDADDLASAYQGLTRSVGFLNDLYNTPFPFAESPRPVMTEERFAQGERMLLEMKCLSCHVFGDLYKEGANANPTAPNLALTHRRLQRRWLDSWLQYPGWIQPGTQMPQWWGDGGSLASFPAESLAEFAGKYGKTSREQLDLLQDFIFEAGYRNHTVIDPTLKAAEQPAAESSEDDISLDEDDSGEKPKKDDDEIDLDELDK